MPDTDLLASRLRRIAVSDAVRADAWDAFHNSSDENDLTERLRGLSIPDDAKADLWDMKAGRTSPPTPRGVSVPGDTFADKLAGVARGFGKAAVHSMADIVDYGSRAGVIPGTAPGMPNAASEAVRAATAYRNPNRFDLSDPENQGAALETVGELAAPAIEVGKLAMTGGRALASAATKLPLGKMGAVAADLATEALPFGRVARKVLSYALEAAKTAKLPPSAMVPGRIVPSQTPKLADVLTEALASARAEPPPRVTLPPEPSLPPGYTPRTTVPKPRAAKMAGPTAAPVAEPPAPPKRAYFLKSEADLAPAASPAPTGTIDPSALPASWQQHIGQDLFPLTGKEGAEVVAALADELRGSGMTVGQAMMAVSKNPDIPVQFRQQLLKSLSRVNMKGGS